MTSVTSSFPFCYGEALQEEEPVCVDEGIMQGDDSSSQFILRATGPGEFCVFELHTCVHLHLFAFHLHFICNHLRFLSMCL